MTRRKWPGRPITGLSLGKNRNTQLPITPLGAGQPPLIPMQMSGSGSGLMLPMAPIWIPPVSEILPPPPPPPPEPVPEFCISFSGTANRWFLGYYPKEPIAPARLCSVNICYDPDDIIPEDNEFFGVIGNGVIYDFGNEGKLICTLDMDGQIFEIYYYSYIYFYDDVPVFVSVGIHEEGDIFAPGEPYQVIDEYCAVQTGVESQIVFTDGAWAIVDNEDLADFYFVFWDDNGYPCPD